MKKRVLSLLLALTLCLGLCAPAATAVEDPTSGSCGAQGDNVTWSFEDGVMTFSGSGRIKDYAQGSSLASRPWTFSYQRDVIKVIIEDGITNVSGGLCNTMTNLTEIVIPDSVTEIGDVAFTGCGRLDHVDLPSSLTSLGRAAFGSCSYLSAITIPDGISIIESSTFSGCTSLTAVTIPASVTNIGSNAFASCGALKTVFYSGSESEWDQITIGTGNAPLLRATVQFADKSPEPPATYQVQFYPNGAGVTFKGSRRITVTNGQPYGELPTVSHPNAVFEGWFTSGYSGQGTRITSDSIVNLTADQELWAHWSEVKETPTPQPTPTPAPKTYTVSFNANGGSVSTSSKTVTEKQTYGALPTPTRSGYTFDGWYTSASGGTQVTDSTTVTLTANQTLYAHWTQEAPKTYTVTFSPNGGTVSPRAKTVTEKQTYGTLPTPTRSGYLFDGWYTSATGGAQVTDSTTVTLTANQTIYAHWTQEAAKTFTVTFDPNGGSVSTSAKTVTERQTYGVLPTPTYTGYTFTGWFTALTGGTRITETSAVTLTANQTLYARWSAKAFSLTFNANGGSVSTKSKAITFGEPYGVLPTPTRTGYTFEGWFTTVTGGQQVTASDIVSLSSNQTLYAHWSAKAFTITFNANGGSVSTKSKAVTAGQTYGELPTPTRESYTFVGWFTDGMGGDQITAAATVKLSADQTLYAHWTAYKIYTLTLDPQGGAVDPATKSVTEKGTYGTLPSPQREGYEFLGWYTARSGGKRIYSSTRIAEQDHTLYAQWKVIPPKTFTVTFNASGGSVSPRTKTVTEKQTYGELPVPTRTGYTFDGWFTTVSGGSQVKADTLVSLSDDQTLYAHWTLIPPKSYTVTFDPNGGQSPDASKAVTEGQTYGELPVPTRESHTFEGWYTSPEGGSKVESYTKVTLTADQTLYAHWKKVDKAYVVTLDANGGTTRVTSLSLKGLQAYGTLPTPTRTGYTFDGWFTAPEGGERVVASTVSGQEADHTLYAHWTVRSFTVTLNANGGQLSGDASKTVSYGQPYGELPTPTRSGYTFDGWYTSATAGSAVTAGTTFTLTANQTLYAHWTAGTYTATLDAAGGTVAPASLTVTSGKKYGTLPTPTRNGYTFQGWYTAPTGGSKVTSSTLVSQTQDHTLYAQWKARSYKVYFYVYGWSESSMNVTYGSPYGTLYSPNRSGYTFEGWYTAQEGGERITEKTVFQQTENQKLYARWKSFTVRFDANGGTVSTQSKNVVGGDTYGTLPTPTRKGYTFEGWYTAKTGGELVTEGSTAAIAADLTLYAHWLQNGATPTFDALSYRDIYNYGGSRNYGGFGYPNSGNNYRIPYERYVTIFGDTQLAKDTYDWMGYWGGNCYGLTSTSAMFFQSGNDVTMSSFRNGASRLVQLDLPDRNSSWGMTLQEFIECMQVSQGSPVIQSAYSGKNQNDLEALCQAVQSFHDSGNHPVLIGMFSDHGGHLVTGYDLVQVSAKESRIMVYDPNYPTEERYITLQKDNAGTYTGWQFVFNYRESNRDDWSSARSDCWFSFVPYSDYYQVWTNRASLTDSGRSLLRVNTGAALIYDSEGNVAAELRDGKLITDREDIYEMLLIDAPADSSTTQSDTPAIWLPTGIYTVVSENPSEEPFQATMTNVDQSATISTSASSVTFAVADEQQLNYVEVNEAEKDYAITLSSTLDNAHQEVSLTGKTAKESTALAQLAGKLYATGTELKSGETLRINDREAASDTLSSDTEALSLRLGRLGEQAESTTFTDVSEGDWYYDAVSYVCDNGLMNGTDAAAFGPGVSTTRAMIVTILYRLSGEPDASPAAFDDVPDGQWFSKAVSWAVENGVAGGYGDGRFGPNDSITREQLATMLYRFAGSPLTAGDISGFRDVDQAGAFALDGLRWAVERGIISGKADGLLDPQGLASRAEVATILMRYCQSAQA